MSRLRYPKTSWQFALINNKLVEIFFSNHKIMGHCYVKVEKYKTKQEKKWIAKDTNKINLSFYKSRYRDKLNGKIVT